MRPFVVQSNEDNRFERISYVREELRLKLNRIEITCVNCIEILDFEEFIVKFVSDRLANVLQNRQDLQICHVVVRQCIHEDITPNPQRQVHNISTSIVKSEVSDGLTSGLFQKPVAH